MINYLLNKLAIKWLIFTQFMAKQKPNVQWSICVFALVICFFVHYIVCFLIVCIYGFYWNWIYHIRGLTDLFLYTHIFLVVIIKLTKKTPLHYFLFLIILTIFLILIVLFLYTYVYFLEILPWYCEIIPRKYIYSFMDWYEQYDNWMKKGDKKLDDIIEKFKRWICGVDKPD